MDRVELVHHEGCPHVAAVHELVVECLRELRLELPIVQRVAAYPSPSVLVDGVDVMGAPGTCEPVDACRVDLPTRGRLLSALGRISSPPA